MARNPNWQDDESENRYSNSDRYTNSDRYSPDAQRMRRGDDRTLTGDNFGMQQRNSYRSDDYATDSNRGMTGRDRDRSQQYGNRNNQTHGDRNFGSYGRQDHITGQNGSSIWSSDYGGDRERGGDSSRGFSGGFGSGFSSGLGSSGGSGGGSSSGDTFRSPTDGDYGQGYFGTGQGSSNYGTSFYGSTTRYGQGTGYGSHVGKGPKGYRRSDERIREDVSEALERHPAIDASEIEVDVKDGVVTLRGHVEERRVKRMAEDAVEHLNGVRDVRNELQIDQSLFEKARSFLFGDTAENEAASPAAANRSTVGKSKH